MSASPVATWLRGTGWILGSSILEKGATVVQTILIARAIGVEDYGRYALLFGTIGMMTPLISLMLPYALVSVISRLSERHPEQVGAVLFLTERISWTLSALLFLLCLISPTGLSDWLLGTPEYGWSIVFATFILSASVVGGIGESILQAKQEFRLSASIRSFIGIFGFAVLIPVILLTPSLNHMTGALALAGLVRAALMVGCARRHRRALSIPTRLRPALRHAGIIWQLAIPAGLLNLVQGGALWVGSYILSRNPIGFSELAILNTGIQWRLPVILVLTALSGTALPMLGAMIGAGRRGDSRRLIRYNIALNLALAIVFCAVTLACSGYILAAYGTGFTGYRYLFALSLIAVVPTVYYNAYQQQRLAEGRMWSQLLLFIPYVLIVVGGPLWIGPKITGVELAYIQLAGWMVVAGIITVAMAIDRHRERAAAPPSQKSA